MPWRRTLFVIAVLTVFCGVLLWLLHDALDDIRASQSERRTQEAQTDPGAQSSSDGEPRDGQLRDGQVRDEDGAPVAGVTIELVWEDESGEPQRSTAVTADDGGYRLPGLAEARSGRITQLCARLGPLLVRAPADRLAALTTATAAASGPGPARRLPRLDFVLPSEFTLGGVVQRAEDRRAAGGATLECAGVTAVSAPDGRFELGPLPASRLLDGGLDGGLEVRVNADGRRELAWSVPRDLLPPAYRDLALLLEPDAR